MLLKNGMNYIKKIFKEKTNDFKQKILNVKPKQIVKKEQQPCET